MIWQKGFKALEYLSPTPHLCLHEFVIVKHVCTPTLTPHFVFTHPVLRFILFLHYIVWSVLVSLCNAFLKIIVVECSVFQTKNVIRFALVF